MRYEIWLGGHYSHFERGFVHCEDGKTLPLRSWVHISRDICLVSDPERARAGDFPVRWYIEEHGLSFYVWDEEVTSILFHNECGRDLHINEDVLKSSKTREYFHAEWY